HSTSLFDSPPATCVDTLSLHDALPICLTQGRGVPLGYVHDDLRLLRGLSVRVQLDSVATIGARVFCPDDVLGLIFLHAAVRCGHVARLALACPCAGASVWRAPRLGLRDLVEAQKRGNGRRVAVGPASCATHQQRLRAPSPIISAALPPGAGRMGPRQPHAPSALMLLRSIWPCSASVP